MENNKLPGGVEALKKNMQRPGLDPNRPVIQRKNDDKAQQTLSPDQLRAESLLGKIKTKTTGRAAEESDYTTNYDQFKSLAVNRPVDKRHVNKLMNAIRKSNLLHLNPIIVNRHMEVIDGQHRLQAAKGLRLPIYFLVDESVSQDDIAGMNSVKKTWQLGDYINFYTTKGSPDFLKFEELRRRHPKYTETILLQICSGTGKRQAADIMNGFINIDRIQEADDIISKLDFFAKHFQQATSARFIEAVLFIMGGKEPYDHARMVQKVELNPFLLVPCADKKGYIRMLQSVYNRGVREDNIVTFLKR